MRYFLNAIKKDKKIEKKSYDVINGINSLKLALQLKKIDEFFFKKTTINYSFVMGRFSPKIGNHFQYFPIDTWQMN